MSYAVLRKTTDRPRIWAVLSYSILKVASIRTEAGGAADAGTALLAADAGGAGTANRSAVGVLPTAEAVSAGGAEPGVTGRRLAGSREAGAARALNVNTAAAARAPLAGAATAAVVRFAALLVLLATTDSGATLPRPLALAADVLAARTGRDLVQRIGRAKRRQRQCGQDPPARTGGSEARMMVLIGRCGVQTGESIEMLGVHERSSDRPQRRTASCTSAESTYWRKRTAFPSRSVQTCAKSACIGFPVSR